MKMAKKLAISVMFDTPTPRRRSPRLGVELLLVEAPSPRRTRARVFAFSGLPRLTYKLCFCSSIPISLTIVHWINANPNK